MSRLVNPFCLAVLFLGILTTTSFALDTVTMTLPANAVQGSGIMGAVYTSPYNVTVNGTPMKLICDDFLFDIPTLPYGPWNATVSTLADLPSRPPRFPLCPDPNNPNGCAVPQSQVFDYSVAAILVKDLLNMASFNNPQAGYISYAIWGIFDPDLLTHNPASGQGHLDSYQLGQVNAVLSTAKAQVQANIDQNGGINLALLPHLVIYTPVYPPGTNSQEFLGISFGSNPNVIVPMPEPSAIMLLALDLLGVTGLVLFFRRRRASAAQV